MLTLTDIQNEIAGHDDYKNLDQAAWEQKIEVRDLTRRSQKDFDWLKPFYLKKLDTLRAQLAGDWSVTLQPFQNGEIKTVEEILDEIGRELNSLATQHDRIFDKLAAVLKEEQLRNESLVVRTDIHDQADYYIDYDNGSDSSDGLSTGNAWKTLPKYTSETVRTPGDRAFLRAGITWDCGTEAEDIQFDESGDVDNYISMIGCDSVTNDPWSDSSDTKPIIDFEDAAHEIHLSGSSFWYYERLDTRRSNDADGSTYLSTSRNIYFKDCDWSDMTSAGREGVNISSCGKITMDGCTWEDCEGDSIAVRDGYAVLIGCTIDAGAVNGSSNGIYCSGGIVDVIECSIGLSNAFDTASINLINGAMARLRNVDWDESYTLGRGSFLYSEDNDATFEEQISYFISGIIQRDTGTTRSGGADSSAKMISNANCGLLAPLVLGDPMMGFAAIWATASVQINISIYARVDTAWDSALAADEAYATFSYLSNAGNADRTSVQSTEQIANDQSWTAFTSGNITPLRTGWVYIWFSLAEYEDASEAILVDIKPVVT